MIIRNKKEFPFGERRAAQVLDVQVSERYGLIVVCGDDRNEGHIIMGHPAPPPIKGERVTLVFAKGGPLGGHWKVETKQERR